jgi:uroporphyrin-III C-methyltransferase
MKTLVYIVGAGPGDPDLISVKGRARLREADVVLHDRLVHPRLLEEARVDAQRIDVGKRRGREDERQSEIHKLMIENARQGKTVCRLQGGDPFIFGRVGEEIQALLSAGIPFEIIPGVSSVTAGPAAAGIPLTHRDSAHGFLVITGSRSTSFDAPEWRAARTLLQAGGTVVVLMGLARLSEITAHLKDNGCPANTPVAVVAHASLPEQEICIGTLENVQGPAEEPPALLILGDVVRFAKNPGISGNLSI